MESVKRNLISLCLSLLMAALLVAAPLASSAPKSRVFELENRQAQTVVPQLRNLYGNDVQLSPDGQDLMVRAEPAQLSEIESLLERIDQPVRQVRLSLRHRKIAASNSNKGTKNRVFSTQKKTVRSLVVRNKQLARISSGRIARLPVAARGGEDPMVVLEEVDMTSGFLVRPTVLSEEQVELHITALRNEPVQSRPGYQTAGVVTIRRVTPGEWVELGEERRSSRSQDNSRVYATQSKSDRYWEVKVEVLPTD